MGGVSTTLGFFTGPRARTSPYCTSTTQRWNQESVNEATTVHVGGIWGLPYTGCVAAAMYMASQITATAIVPFPENAHNTVDKKGVQPYVLLYTNTDGMTTDVDCLAESKFVGVTISETEFGGQNSALTVQLSGISTVRVAKGPTYYYGEIMYGDDEGQCTNDSTADKMVVGRYLGDLGEQEGVRFATMLLCRSAAVRQIVDEGMVYASPYNVNKRGDVILREGVAATGNGSSAVFYNFAGFTNLANAGSITTI